MVTFADTGEGAFNLNSPIAGQIQDATVRGYQLVLRSVLSYSAASRATGSGPRAFEDATKFLVGNMLASVAKKLEIELLYGQVGYGTVASIAGNTITITTSEWAPGIWSGSEKMPIEIRSPAGVLRGTATVQTVSLSLFTVTVDSMPIGVLAGDVIWHGGAYQKEFAGVHAILTNTGTLFGINAANYALWTANVYGPAAPGELSFAIIQNAIALAVGKGLDNEVLVLVNPGQWADLMTEQAAFRLYDSSYSTSMTENGSTSIKFYGQNGAIEIVPSIYVKQGYSYVLSMEDFCRVGSTDVTFKRPGQGDNFFRDMEDSAGYELRCYTDQALFCSKPGKNTIINNLLVV